MLEVLKIIVLTCQVSTGGVSVEYIQSAHDKCVKSLINCVNKNAHITNEANRLEACLLEKEVK